MKNKNFNKNKDFNIGVVVATDEEFDILIKTLNLDLKKSTIKQYEDSTFFNYEWQYKNLSNINIIILNISDMTNTNSATATQWFLSKYNFSCIINIGIAGLMSNDYHLLDVIIGESSCEYDYRGKILDDGKTSKQKYGSKTYNTERSLYETLSQLKNLYPTIYEKWENISHDKIMLNNLLIQENLLLEKQVIGKGALASGAKVLASKTFKGNLLEHNRLYTAIEMESAGFLSAIDTRKPRPKSLVIKAISDTADKRKKCLDETKSGILRKIAMQNATNLLKIFLNIYDFSQCKFIESDQINDNAIYKIFFDEQTSSNKDCLYEMASEGLSDFFKKSDISNEDFKIWGKIFHKISIQDINLNDDSYIEDLFNFINTSGSDTHLNINGNPGTGISLCLSALYRIFYDNYKKNKSAYYPIYIDFRKYRMKIYKDGLNILNQAKKYIVSDIDRILYLLNSQQIKNVLLIFDGVDYESKTQIQMEKEILTKFNSFPKKKIIGERCYSCKKRAFTNETKNITFSSIIIDDIKFNDIVTQLNKLEKKSMDPKKIKEILNNCNFDEIDIFLLRLIIKKSDFILINKDICLLLESFCSDYSEKSQKNMSIDDIADFTFHSLIKGKNFSENKLYNNPAWYLLNRNKEIQYFLIAKYAINSLLSISKGKNGNFNFTYNNRINSYCKSLINKDSKFQKSILDGAKKVLATKNENFSHANVLYLLGRLNDKHIKDEAKEIIEEYLTKNKNFSEKNNKLLMALRTCYISLAYLGNDNMLEEYIKKLLSNISWCKINRGFYLAYYKDIDYDPGVGLNPEDKLEDCPKTYSYLYNRIKTFIKGPLFDIEIYTFFSLIQHRHKDGKFKDEKKLAEIVKLINEILEKNIIEISELKLYLIFLKDIFKKTEYSHFALFRLINKLKFEKRKGWLKRGFSGDIEVVSAHALNAVYMASLLLPQDNVDKKHKNEYKDYDKAKIVEMLLYHDLAECDTHDYLPEEKNETLKAKEKDFYNNLSLYRTSGFFHVKHIRDLWFEFESNNNINSKIAKEIDKLEAYAQFLLYIANGQKISSEDIKIWKKYIERSIETKYGLQIKKWIEKEFESILDRIK